MSPPQAQVTMAPRGFTVLAWEASPQAGSWFWGALPGHPVARMGRWEQWSTHRTEPTEQRLGRDGPQWMPRPSGQGEAQVALSSWLQGAWGQAGGPGSLFTHGCLTSWQLWAAVVGRGTRGSWRPASVTRRCRLSSLCLRWPHHPPPWPEWEINPCPGALAEGPRVLPTCHWGSGTG